MIAASTLLPSQQAPACPEMRALLLCARSTLAPGQSAELRDVLAGGVDWATLLKLAEWHRVVPLLACHLRAQAADLVPLSILQRLNGSFLANTAHNRFRSGELIRLLGLLAEHGIAAVPLKGPTLGAMLYGDVALRQFGDLDILVSPIHADQARQLLLAAGYQPAFRVGQAQQGDYLRFQHHYPFVHPQSGIVVELHYRIREAYFAIAFDTARLLGQRRSVPLGDHNISALSLTDTLLTLCVHGASHSWERLFWLCDIAELLHKHPDLDWNAIQARAQALGCTRIVVVAAALAAALLDAPLPPAIAQLAVADATATRLIATVSARLRSQQAGPQTKRATIRFHLASRERWCDRIRYSLRLALTPTEGDWSLLALPHYASFLYYVFRPFRLAWCYGMRSLQRSQ